MNGPPPEQLPEGIEESPPKQARILEAYRRELLDCFERWGYALVLPPLAEYWQALVAAGGALEQQTFQLTDTLSGRALGIRADITPQIARMDRQLMPQDALARLCYVGSVLRTRPEILGGSRSPMQAGAELYGHDGAQSDAEIVSLLCAALQAVGCRPWCLDLGHAGIFRALIERTGWEADERRQLFELIQRKAKPDIEAWLDAREVADDAAAALRVLPDLSGPDEEVLDRAGRELACVSESMVPVLERLRQVAACIRSLYPDVRLHFDLGEASGFHYESGLVFAAYVEGQGQEIARGGRYGARGRRPAIGFSLDVRTLVRCGALRAPAPSRIYAAWSEDSAQQAAISDLRAAGRIVVCALDPNEAMPQGACEEQLVCEDGAWVVRPVPA